LELTLDLIESLSYFAADIRCAVSFQASHGLADFSQGIRCIDPFPGWNRNIGERRLSDHLGVPPRDP
jgi:hypothetical protein